MILRSLPKWFGIETALQRYAADTKNLPTFLVHRHQQLVGFLSIKDCSKVSAELYVIAVHRTYRGQGIGRSLLTAAESWLQQNNIRYLLVKTLSASHPDPHYEQTRGFYLKQGFDPLIELPEHWGADLPCLLMIKTLVS